MFIVVVFPAPFGLEILRSRLLDMKGDVGYAPFVAVMLGQLRNFNHPHSPMRFSYFINRENMPPRVRHNFLLNEYRISIITPGAGNFVK
jgi:hypothetical protein